MPETADRIESLFAAAVALPPEERDAYLERECSGDPALRERLWALLRAHDRAGHVIDRPVNGEPDQTAGYVSMTEERGTIIAGRYKLLEEIGQGGMGTVWAAEQTTPVRRKVALKLIKAGMDSRSVLARFEAERQALALMDHPNIAKVLDGGLTDSGRPYFVMEYVKGVPITEYCDATRLSVGERLNLFVQVCSALQHAHQKGIIHRDLKPSNILVAPYDDKPVPKVIDFGLAKAMHQSLTEKTLYTGHEMVVGTPLYMSPEQAQLNNLDVDTRADIYSLGVLLYELLTGTTPLERRRFKEAAWDEIRRMIREEEPPRPSVRLSSTDTLPSLATYRHTEPAKLKKLVRGELDWIVMKALEKDRTRRYETASGLARDIQRYLDDEVVEARPPSPGYRIGKFVRRHKAQVITAGLVMIALLAGFVGTTWGLVREARANARLSESLAREQNANMALSAANAKVEARYNLAVEAIKTFHTGVSEDFLLKEEKFKDLRNRLLKSAAEFYDKLSALLGEKTDQASRQALAQANFELANLTWKVGSTEDALTVHRAVLAAREALALEQGAAATAKVEVGRSLTAVATLLSWTGKTVEALAACRRSESLLAELAVGDPAARETLAACRGCIGGILFRMGRTDEAMAIYKLARADREALTGATGASNGARRALADTTDQIGFILRYTGKLSEAETEHRTALEIYQKLARDNPTVTGFVSDVAWSHINFGVSLYLTGKLLEADAEHRTATTLFQKLADDNPAVTNFQSGLMVSHGLLGLLLSTTDKPSAAEAEFRAALVIQERLAADNPTVTDGPSGVGQYHADIGEMLLQMGKPGEAETECRKALAIQQKLADDNPAVPIFRDRLAIALTYLGDVVRSNGRAAEAKGCYDRAISLEEPQLKEDRTDTLHRYYLVCAIRRRGLALRDLGDAAGAAADTRRALTLCDGLPTAFYPSWFETACCRATLAGLAGQDGAGVSVAEGKDAADQAMALLKKAADAGYRNSDALRTESALDALRKREDFKKLLEAVDKPSPAKHGK
jgi:eukaryotic-like serine/threonine-protein kinase